MDLLHLSKQQYFFISTLVLFVGLWIKMIGKVIGGFGLGYPITTFVPPEKAGTFNKIALWVWFILVTIAIPTLIYVVIEFVILNKK